MRDRFTSPTACATALIFMLPLLVAAEAQAALPGATQGTTQTTPTQPQPPRVSLAKPTLSFFAQACSTSWMVAGGIRTAFSGRDGYGRISNNTPEQLVLHCPIPLKLTDLAYIRVYVEDRYDAAVGLHATSVSASIRAVEAGSTQYQRGPLSHSTGTSDMEALDVVPPSGDWSDSAVAFLSVALPEKTSPEASRFLHFVVYKK